MKKSRVAADRQRPPVHRRRQTEPVLLRLEPSQLDLISDAAEYMGLPRAAWMRSALLQAAREVLKQAGGHERSRVATG